MRYLLWIGLTQLTLGVFALGAQRPPEPWGAQPLGPKIEPKPFSPAPIKRELRPALKVNPASGAEMVLVRDGQPMCVLMVADKASGAATEAAKALQIALRKMSGAEVPIVREAELTLKGQAGQWSISHKGARIPYLVAIGNTRLSASHGLVGKDLPLEGYRLKTVSNALFLVGKDLRADSNLPLDGSRHAAMALLERHLGFRWLWPGELGEVVPRSSTVKIPAMDEEDAPAIRKRTLRNYAYGGTQKIVTPADPKQPGSRPGQKLVLNHDRVGAGMRQLGLASDEYVGWCPQSSAWWSQQRLGSSYSISAGHAYGGWWNRFGAQHPEWFALQRNGSRTPGRLPAEREKMCHSNAQLVQQVILEKIAELQREPGRDSVSVSPNDGGGNNSPCLCEACRKLDPVNGRPMPMETYLDGKKLTISYVSLSDRTFMYYNRVAEGLAKVYPDKLLGTYAYSTYRDLPLGVRPHPNLLVGFVGLGYWDDQELEADRQRWEQWAGAAKNLFLRPNAFHQGHGMPGVFVKKLDRDIKRCYQTGMIAADFDSVLHHWATQGLNYYVLAKLLWDPSQDAESIVQDYCNKGFGPAAKAIRRYFQELEEVTDRFAAGEKAQAPAQELREEEDDTTNRHTRTYMRLARTYTPAAIAQLRQTLAEAKEAAGADELVKHRIDFLEAGLRYGELQAQAHGALLAGPAEKARLLKVLDERYAAFRQIVHTQPFAVNVAYIAWREGSMWNRAGWRQPAAGK